MCKTRRQDEAVSMGPFSPHVCSFLPSFSHLVSQHPRAPTDLCRTLGNGRTHRPQYLPGQTDVTPQRRANNSGPESALNAEEAQGGVLTVGRSQGGLPGSGDFEMNFQG